MKHVIVAVGAAVMGAGVALAFGALSVVPRLDTLEHEAEKGERWTLQQQLDYMEREATANRKVAEDIAEIKATQRAICAATEADC